MKHPLIEQINDLIGPETDESDMGYNRGLKHAADLVAAWLSSPHVAASITPETDSKTPTLDALAMQRAAIDALEYRFVTTEQGRIVWARDVVRDITLPPGAALAEAMRLPEIARMRTALQTLRNLMCEAFEADDGSSGCGRCENDCTGCVAHAALAALGEQP